MATPPALRVVEKEWVAWRRLWKASVFQATISPLLFLAAMGLGLGDLVNKGSGGYRPASHEGGGRGCSAWHAARKL